MEPLVAAAAALIYGALCLLLGERTPFSRFGMYARLQGYTEAARPWARVEGQLCPISTLRALAPVDLDPLRPGPYPCSQTWAALRDLRWIESHVGPGPFADRVELGLLWWSVDEQGRLHQRFEPRCATTGRRA